VLRSPYFSCKSVENREPTRGLEPLTCSLRVMGHVLQGLAEDCKSRIFRRLFLHWVAECCTVLRSRWYQRGINSRFAFAFDLAFCQAGTHFVTVEFVLTGVH
jgi:hypothetical protein